MKSRSALLALAAGSVLAVAPQVQAAGASVTYADGLISIRCKDTPLSQVFDQLKAAAGLEVTLDGAVKSVRLTAEIDAQPLNFALERLLEGTGVNYAMWLDRGNWQRVAKIYVGSAGTVARGSSPAPVSTPTPQRRAPVARPADAEEDQDMEEPDVGEPETPAPADAAEPEVDEAADEGAEPPGASPAPTPSYLPPPPAFPRSSFTPGLDQNPFGGTQQPATAGTPPPGSAGAGAGTTQPGNPPPAYFPFFDAFGRPIPVNPQQQQQPQQQGQQKKQQ